MCVVQCLDAIPNISNSEIYEQPLRILMHDVVRMTTSQLQITGKVVAGSVETGDKLFAMPDAIPVIVSRGTFVYNYTYRYHSTSQLLSVTNLEDTTNFNASPSRTPSRHIRESKRVHFAGEQVDLLCSGTFEPTNTIHLLCRGGSVKLSCAPLKVQNNLLVGAGGSH